MVLAAPPLVPPIVLDGLLTRLTPTPLPRLSPVAFTPMRFPSTALPVAVPPLIRIPAPLLKPIRFPEPVTVPPMVFSRLPDR